MSQQIGRDVSVRWKYLVWFRVSDVVHAHVSRRRARPRAWFPGEVSEVGDFGYRTDPRWKSDVSEACTFPKT